MGKLTLVIGASENSERYSHKAIRSLLKHNHPVLALGNKIGNVAGIAIGKEKMEFKNVDTITLYIGVKHQAEYYDYLLSLKPKRIIFNPGAENEELEALAQSHGIEILEACTLVLLSIGQY